MRKDIPDIEIGKLSGERAKEQFMCSGNGPWTVLYDREGSAKSPDTEGSYSVLAPRELRAKFLNTRGWDFHIGQGRPGTITTYGETESTSYMPFGNDVGCEPLVIVTDGIGPRKSEILINQEFRLAFELFEDMETGNLIEVAGDGTETTIVEVSDSRVRARSSYLARFRALKQLDLWLYTESMSHFLDLAHTDNFERFNMDWKTENFAGSNDVGGIMGHPTAMFMAKKVFTPPPIEYCNLWEYEDRSQIYESFVIGEDKFGKKVSFTCEEDQLRNYFGKNPDAPHYLTPVFFRSDVLQKYYNNPELYTVSSGSVVCHALWNLRADNDHSEYVAVFLGDLGRDLPESERQYWKGFNIAPYGDMSTSYARRSYLGEWTDAEQPDHQFKEAYTKLHEQWRSDNDWQIYREPHDIDQHILNRLHVPLNETQTEFEDQLLILAKLLVDFLNEKSISQFIGRGPDNERGISKMQRFLFGASYQYVDEDTSLLREIQELRSKVSAHSKGSNYDAYIVSKLSGKTKKELVRELHQRSTLMLKRWIEFSPVYAASGKVKI